MPDRPASDPDRPTFTVRWADLDANGHMSNTAYLDTCVDARFAFFTRHGFTAADFVRHGIGPVVRRDEIDFHRELRFMDPFAVDIALAGISDDGSRFRLRNRFYRGDGPLAAVVTSTGGWLDLAARRLVAAPEPLLGVLLALPRTEDFTDLPSSLKPSP